MSKTIKQIADELSVSKTSVYKKIDNLGLRLSLRKIANQFTVDETQEKQIKQAFSKNDRKPVIDNQSITVYSDLNAAIDALIKQLDIKDEQLKQANIQNENLTAALAAAHALHAGTLQQLLPQVKNSEVVHQTKSHWWNIKKSPRE